MEKIKKENQKNLNEHKRLMNEGNQARQTKILEMKQQHE